MNHSPKKIILALITNTQIFPLVLALTIFGFLFILFRMKGIEQDYKYNEISTKIEQTRYDKKDLSAQRARLLSINNLRSMAAKHKLKQPTQDQIIIIP